MNTFFRHKLHRIIELLQVIYDRQLDKIEEKEPPYSPLSPTNQATDTAEYRSALDWAIRNRKKEDIKNIALTGPYGSGKSSILKTYIENNTDCSLHFLPISLATFKEEEEETKPDNKPIKETQGSDQDKTKSQTPPKNDLLRLIELSILQQIFYHEKDSKIPDSRFRKIRSFSFTELIITTIILMLVIVSAIHLSYPGLLVKELRWMPSATLAPFIHWTAIISVFFGTGTLIFRSIRMFSSLKVSKLNFQNAEINIGEHVSKSVLNHHLDEILYFFEKTPYNVVIIEDLDRFRQTDIFTKLREINLLINNSAKVKKDVVFVYAVRDDMFREDNERTKFFDFIIPVIPVINPSNSSQKLLDKKKKYNFDISENLIDSLSMFVDDMRLLHNITNEYYLYHLKLNKSLIQDKLLAMIVYKNLFPNDFTDLSRNKGQLFEALTGKQAYIKTETKKIRDQIDLYKGEIAELENIKIKDIKELRNSYLLYVIESLPGFISFSINSSRVPTKTMTEDANFDAVRNGRVQYLAVEYYKSQNYKTENVDFKSAEEKVDEENDYGKRKQQIDDINNNKINTLKKQIAEGELSISRLRSLKIRELMEKGNIEIKLPHEKQNKIINVLLRDGFIDEDYLDYISLFYEGSLSKEDYQFLLNIKTRVNTPFEFTLYNTSNLIGKINPFDFDKPYVYNYNLVDYLLITTDCKLQCKSVFSSLAGMGDQAVSFINGYIDNGKNIHQFIQQLIKKWPGIWTFVQSKSLYDDDRKRLYFSLLVEHSDLIDIETLYKDVLFKNALLSRPDFLSVIPDKEKLKKIIEQCKIKLINLDKDRSPDDLHEFVYANNWYKLNPEMLRVMLQFKEQWKEEEFNKNNYAAITRSGCSSMVQYIDEYIDEYISDVYLHIKSNTDEPEDSLILLLNHAGISENNKQMILQQVNTRINELTKIIDVDVKLAAIEANRVLPTWTNVFDYYQADGSTGVIFLKTIVANPDNLKALSEHRIPIDSDAENKIYQPFIMKILLFNDLDDDIYNTLLKSIPYRYPSFEVAGLNQAKVAGLVDMKKLDLSPSNYNKIKETKSPLHLALLKIHKSTYLSTLSEYEIDADDLSSLLASDKFSISEKNVLTEHVSETLLISDDRLLQKIGELVLQDHSFRLSPTVLRSVLVAQRLSIEQRIRILAWKHDHIENTYLPDFLNVLGEPYSDITLIGKRPTLEPTEYNQKLADVLQSKGYISSYTLSDKGVKIATFTKETES